VYGDGGGKTFVKMVAIGVLYAIALVLAVAGTLVWTVYL
jgi:hypothetical protein